MFLRLKFLLIALMIGGINQAQASSDEKERGEQETTTFKRAREEEAINSSASSSDDESERKKRRISMYLREEQSQVYAIPTYDATFKYLMSDEEICLSFLRAFVPDENITGIKHLDTHLRPFKEYQKARSFVNESNSKKVVKKIKELMDEEEVKDNVFSISFIDTTDDKAKEVHGGGEFIKGLAEIYGDLLRNYPKPHRNSQVDLICEVNKEYYALVEVQVVPQDYWDKRALAYAANIYGRQLREGEEWDNIKKVICVNLLGGGPESTKWPSRTGFSRLTFKDQDNIEIEEGIEVLQYPLFYDELKEESEKRVSEEGRTEYLEWLEFFEHAHDKKEDDVEEVKTEEVRKAYEKVKASQLPDEVREEYLKQEKEVFKKYSQHTEYLKQQAKREGIEEEKIKTSKRMIQLGLDNGMIAKIVELSEEEIEKIREGMSPLTSS